MTDEFHPLAEGPVSEQQRDDFRRGPRRRGRDLEEVIYRATLEELADHGFDGLSIERVADRAGTGKSAIYRRWATKLDLVVDTIADAFPEPDPVASTGELRGDLLRFHRQMAQALDGRLGAALRANLGRHHEHPELRSALQERVIVPHQQVLHELLVAGVERGEVRPQALTPECIDVGPGLVRQRFMESGTRMHDRDIVRMVDNILIPMLRRTSQSEASSES
jgi:AcrR family transcriptional regulator